MAFTDKLKELAIELPSVAAPVAAYVPAVHAGGFVYTSGQLPFLEGKLPVTGLVGDEVDEEAAYEQARVATLNALAAIHDLVGIDNVTKVVKVNGFVASAKGFNGQPAVLNGASELLGEIFGPEVGAHARAAVGVAELPLGAPVEVEIIVQVATK
ncbi:MULTISPECIES: RidA family protein [Corynebacterium]|uniref:RidA family protein n=1 Tax=Corynebacterium TaxID=1716 RepID=UPI0008A3E07A|nr:MULTISPECIES: RidA family protein [Corynebacterium]MCX2162587.1 RidA family protein [Corynebacterium auriscanis]OFT88748.1 LysR family transcriptional regulator [Corynebacterium sp. HMSC28B08]